MNMKSSKNSSDAINQLRTEIITTVAQIARINEKSIDDDVLIKEELGIDSLMYIEIIAKIEKHFNIKIDEEEVERVETVGQFIDYILSKRSKK